MSTPTDVEPGARRDGRTTRWTAHRTARRAELVTATLRAIRRGGAGVGMDDIAAVAGTSKTVFYRHFGDRAGLYRAVAEAVDGRILQQITSAVTGLGEPGDASARGLVRAALDTYLRLVEEDPEVYRFVVAAPLVPATERTDTDPASAATELMSGRIAELLAAQLVALGRPPARARTWGHAVVGMVRSIGDHWLRHGASASGTSRDELVDDVTTLLWEGLASNRS